MLRLSRLAQHLVFRKFGASDLPAIIPCQSLGDLGPLFRAQLRSIVSKRSVCRPPCTFVVWP